MKIGLTLAISFIAATTQAADKPNILYIMSDDHAAHGIGAYGGRLAAMNPTPTIDRLAQEGAIFRNAFCINSICTPSRASVLTGQYSHTSGVKTLSDKLPPERHTLAHGMNAAGYETAMIGKWHLKVEPSAFDFYTVLPGQGAYFNPTFRVRGPHSWPKNTITVGGYDSKHSSDAITDISLKWLKNRKEKDKPFFLMHHFKAPHDNFENAERYDFLWENTAIPEPESLWVRGNHGPQDRDQYGTSVGKRNSRRNMGDHMFIDDALTTAEYKREAYQRYLKKFLRCVRGVDDNIARLLKHLEKTGELDNTVIIYTSDQGFMLGEHDYIDKRWMYEESLRMPLIIRYPKAIKAGTEITALVNETDFAPSLLELAGVTEIPDTIQGRSLIPILESGGQEPADWRQATYYRYWMNMTHHDNPAHYGIRTKTHKLILFYGLPLDAKGALQDKIEPYWELYDLQSDPHEMNNVYNNPAYTKIQKTLKTLLKETKLKLGDTDEQYPALKALVN